MKVNPTVALTLLLLALMGGAGVISAAWGYALGREALKGITQPDVRPVPAGGEDAQSQPRHQEMMIVPETKILEEVKGRINGNGAIAQPENAQSSTMQPIQSGTLVQPVVQPVSQPNAVQPSVLSPALPSNLQTDTLPSGDLPPDTLPLEPLAPGEFSPSGFNRLPTRQHTVGLRVPQGGSEDRVAGYTSDRPLANPRQSDVATSRYGVERVFSFPSNRHG